MTCFSSADESAHYGFSVCMLLDQYRAQLHWEEEGVVELGTGDATAIADVVRSLPDLRVRSYDISPPSVETARANIAARGVSGPELAAELRRQGRRGLSLLQFGLAGYAKRR